MNARSLLPMATAVLSLAGCKPNLIVQDATIDFAAKTVAVTVKNVGNASAGAHLTYIEINDFGAPAAVKPQSQYSAAVAGIPAGGSWLSGPVPFSSFSSPRGLDLNALTAANLVVRADAKGNVAESNETDNVHDADYWSSSGGPGGPP
jgi:hypothetical protein